MHYSLRITDLQGNLQLVYMASGHFASWMCDVLNYCENHDSACAAPAAGASVITKRTPLLACLALYSGSSSSSSRIVGCTDVGPRMAANISRTCSTEGATAGSLRVP